MTVEKAEAMIRLYGAVLQKSVHPAVFQPKKSLPCSVARMKFAIFRYITELHRRGELKNEQIENMIVAYSHLSFFVDENIVNHLNAIMLQKDDNNKYSSRLKNDYKDVIHSIAQQKEGLIREIKEFILECREYVKN
jgi:predicted AlkP superfamily phosphohydrolase/phosphomutase